jgi:hypothetical protein
MQTTSIITTTTDRLAAFGDLRVVECSRGTAHPEGAGRRTRVAPTSLLAPSARTRPATRR